MSHELTKKEYLEQCECCGKFKLCKMYVIPTLEAAWICKEYREGKK